MIPIPAFATRLIGWFAADLKRLVWAVTFLLLATCAVLFGALAVANSNVEKLTAQLATKDAECNQRVLDDIAAAERVAREAQHAATRAERAHWKAMLNDSQQAVREARSGHEMEAERADRLNAALAASYRSDPDANELRAMRVPESIRRELREGTGDHLP